MTSQPVTAKAQTIIHKPAEAVFAAFVDPAHMCKFWFPRSDGPLEQGKTVHWFIGTADDSMQIEVKVISLAPSESIVIEWGVAQGEDTSSFTTATWTLEAMDDAQDDQGTVLKIQESGFTGTPEEITARALDSTGGFNQVVIAAKAYLEHGVAVNIVTDHA